MGIKSIVLIVLICAIFLIVFGVYFPFRCQEKRKTKSDDDDEDIFEFSEDNDKRPDPDLDLIKRKLYTLVMKTFERSFAQYGRITVYASAETEISYASDIPIVKVVTAYLPDEILYISIDYDYPCGGLVKYTKESYIKIDKSNSMAYIYKDVSYYTRAEDMVKLCVALDGLSQCKLDVFSEV